MNKKEREVIASLATALVDSHEAMGHLTCSEVDTVAQALARLGQVAAAESVILGHTYGDQDDDDAHAITHDGGRLTDKADEYIRRHVRALVAGTIEPGDVMHDARPDDDNEPGDRCKDCGRDITWEGPGPYDWLHVDEQES